MPTGLEFELNFNLSGHFTGRVLEEEIETTGNPLTEVILVLVATPSTWFDLVLELELFGLSTVKGSGFAEMPLARVELNWK